jgi:hypothetical protein
MLRLGAAASLAIALLHVGIAIAGPDALRYFGSGERAAELAASGSPLPAAVTVAIAVLFAGFGACALAAAARRAWPGRLRAALVVVAVLYLLRGIGAIPQSAVLLSAPFEFPVRFLVFSLVALVVGLVHVAGLVGAWKESRQP